MSLPLTDQQRLELAEFAKIQAQKVMSKIPLLGMRLKTWTTWR